MRIENLLRSVNSNIPKKEDFVSIKIKENDQIQKLPENKSEDKIELSEAALAQNNKFQLRTELDAANASADAQSETFSNLGKCLIIAQRILNGDTVSRTDTLFLQENEPDLYEQAVTLRMKNEDPKDHKSITEDDLEETSSSSTDETPEDISLETGAETDNVKPDTPTV